MFGTAPIITAVSLALEPSASLPIYRQLYERLRSAILSGEFAAGARLPSTRSLASDLALSRTTVTAAYEQLCAEGYIAGRAGSGTYVASVRPDDLLQIVSTEGHPLPVRPPGGSLARRAARFPAVAATNSQSHSEQSAFRLGLPALDAFPRELWATLISRYIRQGGAELLGRGNPAGYLPLREAIAVYLRATRGVHCTPDQVIVTSGAQQGLDLAARLLLDEGDAAWIEDPGYLGARGALLGAGARLVPVPVDAEGLDVAAGIGRSPAARLVYVTPSHQYPLGVTMSLSRRLALLEWANRAGAWILEDDYDSEYRYAGRPLAALHGLDSDRRVIYLGTLSKVLFPSLRLGYMIVPPGLVGAFTAARAVTSGYSPVVDQAAVAAFFTEGHFSRHIRRMRALYAERQAALVEAAGSELDGLLDVRPAASGMHLMGWLPPGVDDVAVATRARAAGIEVQPLSLFCIEVRQRGGLALGYAATSTREIREGMRQLATTIRSGT